MPRLIFQIEQLPIENNRIGNFKIEHFQIENFHHPSTYRLPAQWKVGRVSSLEICFSRVEDTIISAVNSGSPLGTGSIRICLRNAPWAIRFHFNSYLVKYDVQLVVHPRERVHHDAQGLARRAL